MSFAATGVSMDELPKTPVALSEEAVTSQQPTESSTEGDPNIEVPANSANSAAMIPTHAEDTQEPAAVTTEAAAELKMGEAVLICPTEPEIIMSKSTADDSAIEQTTPVEQNLEVSATVPAIKTVVDVSETISIAVEATPISKKRPASDIASGMGISKKARLPFKSPMVRTGEASTTETPKKSSVTANTTISNFKARAGPSTPFRSPMRVDSAQSPNADSSFGLSLELKKLDQRINLLKNAIKIKNLNNAGGDQSDEHLQNLSDKWKEAARNAADLLWTLSDAANQDPANAMSVLGNGAFTSSYGRDNTASQSGEKKVNDFSSQDENKSDTKKSESNGKSGAENSQRDADKDAKPSWNCGKMLQMLGWNDQEEMFV